MKVQRVSPEASVDGGTDFFVGGPVRVQPLVHPCGKSRGEDPALLFPELAAARGAKKEGC